MKERPILFSGQMVRAILDGRKTMTRRVVDRDWWDVCEKGTGGYIECNDSGILKCKYGQPEDRLWVRETFVPHLCCGMHAEEIHYRADGESCPIDGTTIKRWKPSIFMPRWASRITLEITSVRVERLKDISEADAEAEGVCPNGNQFYPKDQYKWAFRDLWDSINSARGYGWDVNPWVWVIEFRRCV